MDEISGTIVVQHASERVVRNHVAEIRAVENVEELEPQLNVHAVLHPAILQHSTEVLVQREIGIAGVRTTTFAAVRVSQGADHASYIGECRWVQDLCWIIAAGIAG